MSILNENWKEKLAQLLDRDVDQVDAVIQKKDFSFSDFLELGRAVEQEDIATLVAMFKSDSDIQEADNPFSGSDLPTTPSAMASTTPTTPTTTPSQNTRAVTDLRPGDPITVKDLTGKEVTTTVKSRGPGDTYMVKGSDGDSVVTPDNILLTPTLGESILSESMADGLQTLRTTLPQYKQDPPSITKKAIQEIYNGHQLPPRLSIAIQPYIKMLDAVISDSTMRYRFINLIKMANNDFSDGVTTDLTPDQDDQKPVTKETVTAGGTGAGAIATAPVNMGPPVKRKSRTTNSERSKKK